MCLGLGPLVDVRREKLFHTWPTMTRLKDAMKAVLGYVNDESDPSNDEDHAWKNLEYYSDPFN